jgi:hypothetical protein
MSTPTDDYPESTPPPDGTARPEAGMGVSSERIGHTGPDQEGMTGVKDVRPVGPDEDTPPEQSAAQDEEPQPVGLEPKAGYPSTDPRSAEKPYTAPPA